MKEQKELTARERRGLDTSKVASASAELCTQLPLHEHLLLGVVLHSSSPVTMAIPMSHWVYLNQVRDSPVWITIRDFLIPSMLLMRTARAKCNRAKLYGPFAALCFILMETNEDQSGESESLPEWPNLCCHLRQLFGYFQSDRWPLDDDWLLEDLMWSSIPLKQQHTYI